MAAVAAVAMGVKSGIVLRRRRAWLALEERAPRGHMLAGSAMALASRSMGLHGAMWSSLFL